MIRLLAAIAALFCLAAPAAAQSIAFENGFWVQKHPTGSYRWEKAGGYGHASWKWYPAAVKVAAAPTYTYNFYGSSSQPYAAQGSTVYAAQSIPALDPNEFFANAAAYQQDASRNASKAYSEFSQNASQVFSQQANLAEQQQAAAFATAVLQQVAAVAAATRAQQSTTFEKNYSATGGVPAVPPGALGEIYAASCVGCHSPAAAATKGGGLDLSKWHTLDDATIGKSFSMMRKGTMPKGGSPVPAELQLRAQVQFEE